MCGHKRVRAQTCLGTKVCGHNRVGSSIYGHNRGVSVLIMIILVVIILVMIILVTLGLSAEYIITFIPKHTIKQNMLGMNLLEQLQQCCFQVAMQ